MAKVRICPLCNETVLPTEKIKIISGTTILDESGGFLINENFIEKSIVYHSDCLRIPYNNPKKKLIENIMEWDGKAVLSDVIDFIDENIHMCDQEIIKSWFNRY